MSGDNHFSLSNKYRLSHEGPGDISFNARRMISYFSGMSAANEG